MYNLLVSTGFIFLTCVLTAILRRGVNKITPPGLQRLLLLEFVTAMELCGCCFELCVVADNYGILMYSVYLFSLTIWWSGEWGLAAGCPYIHIENVLMGSDGIINAILKILAEIAGGILVFKYVAFVWNLELSDYHVGKAQEDCTSDVQVTVLMGAVIEGVATCCCRVVSMLLSDVEPQYGSAIDSFIATSMVVAAFNYSGGYFNPVLATSLKYGCKGNTFTEHVCVYWVGATLGSAFACLIYNHLFREKVLTSTRRKSKSE